MHLIHMLPFLAPAAATSLALAHPTVDAAGRNIVCFQVDPSTVFVPTTVFVTAAARFAALQSDTSSATQLTLTETLDETTVVSAQPTPDTVVEKKIFVIEYPKWGNGTNGTDAANCTTGHNGTVSHPLPVNVSDASVNKTQTRRSVVYLSNW